MASLHVFISLWINSSMPNDGGATWKSYGKAFGSSNSWRTKLWSFIALCQSRSKYARKEQWRRGKQRTAAAVFFRTFGALPEVHFLHVIYHFKALEVKNSTLQTVHDLELKWGRYGLRKPTAPAYAKISHSTRANANFAFSSHLVRITHACCEFCSALCRLHFRYFPLYFVM